MSDIDKVLREEGVPSIDSEVKPAIWPRPSPVAHLTATQFQPGQSGNPSGRPSNYTLTRALREVGTVGKAKAVAETMYDLASGGNVRAAEFIRDSTEGKPGVRIADGEWNPETSPQFTVMQAFMQRVVGQPQTAELPQPDATAADGEDTEG